MAPSISPMQHSRTPARALPLAHSPYLTITKSPAVAGLELLVQHGLFETVKGFECKIKHVGGEVGEAKSAGLCQGFG